MKLFDDRERTRMEPKTPGEDDYTFYDTCARPGYDDYRARLNDWFAQLPEAAQKHLLPRFRKNESLEYQRALAELTIHAALKRQGYTVDVQPERKDTDRKPDFLVKDAEGRKIAYVEVTTFGPARELIGKQKRAADVYNGVDKAKLPAGCRLGLDILKHGAQTPGLKALRRKIEAWAKGAGTIDPNDPPTKLFEIDDWKIEIVLFGGFKQEEVPAHAIAAAMGEGRIVKAETEIREAVSDKGKRYGELDAPYVVVVADCKDELVGGDHNSAALLDAAFGSVITQARQLENGQHEFKDVRIDDGYWGTAGGPRHRNVSGIILLPKPHLWDLRGSVSAASPAQSLGRESGSGGAITPAGFLDYGGRRDRAGGRKAIGGRPRIAGRVAAPRIASARGACGGDVRVARPIAEKLAATPAFALGFSAAGEKHVELRVDLFIARCASPGGTPAFRGGRRRSR